MKKLIILLLISSAAFGQRLGIIDQDTTKRPPTGLAAMAYNNGVLKIVRPSGSSYRVITDNNTYTNPSWFVSIPASKVSDFTSASQTVGDARYLPITGGTFTGTSGAGFAGFSAQSSAPSTPSTGFRLYANSSNALSWKGSNGYTRTFDGTANTGNWSYTLQNANGIIPLLESTQTWSGVNTFSGTTTLNGLAQFNSNGNTNGLTIDATSAAGTAKTLQSYGNSPISFNPVGPGVIIGSTTYNSGLKLDVAGQTRLQSAVVFGPYAGGAGGMTIDGSSGSSTAKTIQTYASSMLAINALGNNVGIGTTTDAGYKLDVNGMLRVQAAFFANSSINITAGANKAVSTATLSGGTVTVNSTFVTANSIIYVTGQSCTNCGSYYISAKSAGVSFTITSTNASDASTVAFLIIN